MAFSMLLFSLWLSSFRFLFFLPTLKGDFIVKIKFQSDLHFPVLIHIDALNIVL